MDFNNSQNGIFNQFQTNQYMDANRDFFRSNSIVAQVAFLILVVFVFIISLRLGISILAYFLSPTSNPKLVDGMVDAKQLIVIPQDPNTKGSITLNRSVNASEGLEFSWSVWINISDLTYNTGQYRCVFYKGNDYAQSSKTEERQGLNFPNNAPGLYIAPNTNALIVMMNTFNVINEEIRIDDIPLNKWVNVIIKCENNTLDVYINGTIIKSHELHGVPKQNYGDVYIAPNGGFDGYISNLQYFNHALNISEISKLSKLGPSLKMSGSSLDLKTDNGDYLSLRWFFSGDTPNEYN